MGWFYGFKLHLVVNGRGELLAFRMTPGNVDDREPVPELTAGLTGKLIGDRGSISQQCFDERWERGLQWIIKIREHARHCSVVNGMVNILAALGAYTHQPRKPSLNLSQNNLKLLTCAE